jgi:hypothetical protein
MVRQKWKEGGKWWEQYERYINGKLEMSARQVHRIVKPYSFPLRLNPKLGVRVPLDRKSIKISVLLDQLRKATGLTFALAEGLIQHEPDFGELQSGKDGWRAWQLMEIIEKQNLKNGHWKKTNTGYLLTGSPFNMSLFSITYTLTVNYSVFL